MIRIRIEQTGSAEDIERRGHWAAERIVQRAAAEAAREMRIEAPQAFSTLTQSIAAVQLDRFTWQVAPAVRYAEAVIEGRGPGKQPPFQAIYDWVRVKGLGGEDPRAAAFLIARAIGRRGTEGRDFITPVGRWIEERLPVLAETIMRDAFSGST